MGAVEGEEAEGAQKQWKQRQRGWWKQIEAGWTNVDQSCFQAAALVMAVIATVVMQGVSCFARCRKFEADGICKVCLWSGRWGM